MDSIEPSPAELFLASFQGGYDDDEPWKAVDRLRLLGTQEVFDLAVGYSGSPVPLQRARALQVLAQLQDPFVEERISIALDHFNDQDPLVVPAAAWALAHLKGDRATDALIPLRHHSDPEVRLAVAHGLGGTARGDAIQAVLELMEDTDDEVRNWATFGLGQLYPCDYPDSPEIREAFRKRLDDSFTDVRDEAVWALALREDPQGLQILIDRLTVEPCYLDDKDAAEVILDLDLPGGVPVAELREGLRKRLEGLR